MQAVERDPLALAFQKELAADKRKELDKDRKEITAELDALGTVLHEAVLKLATPEQLQATGPYKPPLTQLDGVNLSTMFGLTAIGFCLLAGLFNAPPHSSRRSSCCKST